MAAIYGKLALWPNRVKLAMDVTSLYPDNDSVWGLLSPPFHRWEERGWKNGDSNPVFSVTKPCDPPLHVAPCYKQKKIALSLAYWLFPEKARRLFSACKPTWQSCGCTFFLHQLAGCCVRKILDNGFLFSPATVVADDADVVTPDL